MTYEVFGADSVLPPNFDDAYPEHDHLYDEQEAVYLLLSGTADLHLPGRVVALDPETFVRVGPATGRRIRTGPGGARISRSSGSWLVGIERRLPHRARYLRLDYSLAQRLLDAHRAWLDDIETELGRPPTGA